MRHPGKTSVGRARLPSTAAIDKGSGGPHGFSMATIDRLRARLTERFAPVRLEIIDESARHAGHAGARPGGETHFRVTIVSAAFAGQNRVARQRAVYGVLAEELARRRPRVKPCCPDPRGSRITIRR